MKDLGFRAGFGFSEVENTEHVAEVDAVVLVVTAMAEEKWCELN